MINGPRPMSLCTDGRKLVLFLMQMKILSFRDAEKRKAEEAGIDYPQQSAKQQKKGPLPQYFDKLHEASKTKYKALFDIVYMLAKNHRPLSDTEMQVQLAKKLNVELAGEDHQNRFAAREFIASIAAVLRNSNAQSIIESRFLSLLGDGSTDRSIIEQESAFVRYCDQGVPKTSLVDVVALEYCDANGVLAGLLKALESRSLKIENLKDPSKPGPTMVCANFDGASVNMGEYEGVGAKLKRDFSMEWLIVMWCVAHKIELAMLDAVKSNSAITQFEEHFKSVLGFYDKLHVKNRREAKSLAEILDEMYVHLPPIKEQRWVASKVRANQAMRKDYHILVSHLTTVAAGTPGHTQSTREVKAGAYLKYITSPRFLYMLHFLIDVLEIVKKMSLAFQSDDLLIFQVPEKVKACIVSLLALKKIPGPTMKIFMESYDRKNKKFKAEGGGIVDLCGPCPDLKYTDASTHKILDDMVKYLKDRFKDFLSESGPVRAFKIFNYNLYPNDNESLAVYGAEELVTLLTHFSELFDEAEIAQAQVEFPGFKACLAQYKGQPPQTVHKFLLRSAYDGSNVNFPVMMKLLELMIVISCSTAKVERSFSQLNLIKTAQRQSMSQDLLRDLMIIQIEGPSLEDFDPIPAIEHYLTACQGTRHNLRFADSEAELAGPSNAHIQAEARLAELSKL